MTDQRPTINASELTKLLKQENKPEPLTTDEVSDYAAAALLILRGLPRGQKLRVIRRMSKILG